MISKHWLPAVIIVRLLAVDAVVEVLSLTNEIFILVHLKNLTTSSFIWKRLTTLSVYIRPSSKVITFYAISCPLLLICFTVCTSHCKACSRMTMSSLELRNPNTKLILAFVNYSNDPNRRHVIKLVSADQKRSTIIETEAWRSTIIETEAWRKYLVIQQTMKDAKQKAL